MNKVKVLIVDDEKNSREVLKKLLEDCTPEIKIIHEAYDVESAYLICQAEMPDIVFLDIQMPRSIGFNLLKKFSEVPFETIFVTSYDQFAISAIKFNALDYLLKPIDISELVSAIEKAILAIKNKSKSQEKYINLIHNLEQIDLDKNFMIHTGGKVKIINSRDVLYIEGDGRYSEVFMINNDKFFTAKNLKDYEDFFGEKSKFIRINKSIIINSQHIKEYNKGEPFIISMLNNISFEASRRRKSEILKKLYY